MTRQHPAVRYVRFVNWRRRVEVARRRRASEERWLRVASWMLAAWFVVALWLLVTGRVVYHTVFAYAVLWVIAAKLWLGQRRRVEKARLEERRRAVEPWSRSA